MTLYIVKRLGELNNYCVSSRWYTVYYYDYRSPGSLIYDIFVHVVVACSGVVRVTELVDEPLRTFRLAHDAFFVVLPQTPRQFVVVHGRPVLAAAPQTRHRLTVFDLEHSLFPVQPPDHLLLLLLLLLLVRGGAGRCRQRRRRRVLGDGRGRRGRGRRRRHRVMGDRDRVLVDGHGLLGGRGRRHQQLLEELPQVDVLRGRRSRRRRRGGRATAGRGLVGRCRGRNGGDRNNRGRGLRVAGDRMTLQLQPHQRRVRVVHRVDDRRGCRVAVRAHVTAAAVVAVGRRAATNAAAAHDDVFRCRRGHRGRRRLLHMEYRRGLDVVVLRRGGRCLHHDRQQKPVVIIVRHGRRVVGRFPAHLLHRARVALETDRKM